MLVETANFDEAKIAYMYEYVIKDRHNMKRPCGWNIPLWLNVWNLLYMWDLNMVLAEPAVAPFTKMYYL